MSNLKVQLGINMCLYRPKTNNSMHQCYVAAIIIYLSVCNDYDDCSHFS